MAAATVSHLQTAGPTSYTTQEAAQAAGLPYRVLDHWLRTGRARASVPAAGSGSRRAFTTVDVRALVVAARFAALCGTPLPASCTDAIRAAVVERASGVLMLDPARCSASWLPVDDHGLAQLPVELPEGALVLPVTDS